MQQVYTSLVCVCVFIIRVYEADRTSRYYYYNVVKKMHITRVTTHARRLPSPRA